MGKVSKNRRKEKNGTKQIISVSREHIDAWVSDGLLADTEEEAVERLTRIFTKLYKSRGYKNFEIRFE